MESGEPKVREVSLNQNGVCTKHIPEAYFHPRRGSSQLGGLIHGWQKSSIADKHSREQRQ